PPWGRPPGGRGGVGRYMEETEDVYRFQEVDSDGEKNGVLVDPHFQKIPNGKQFNPDELYFNDMDLRAWEKRTGPMDGMGYGEDYGYPEDEEYYDDIGGPAMSPAEYEELVFQSVLDKIRLARASGEPDVQLTPEELDIYRSRLLRPKAPAAHPQSATARAVSVPLVSQNNAALNTSANPRASGSGSAKSSKSKQRTSIFAPRPKKKEPSGRKRAPSNVSETFIHQPPGFVVPGPSGHPVYAPINAYQGRVTRDATVRPGGSPSRPASRSASISGRPAATPPRVTPPREIPGAFPSGSPRLARPPSSSSSRHSSLQDSTEWQIPATNRTPSSIQQPAKLVPFPVTDYQHYSAEPYQYQMAGRVAPAQTSSPSSPSHAQYGRRVVSGPADGNHMSMPRRVPVPVQRATPMSNVQGSYSDPTLGHPGFLPGEEASGESSSSGKDGERRRRSGRSRRKN
ncbi:hypothetical protein K491DRAFT_605283, partial [Lophiostoma macrostomum CBS 122681]